MKRLLQRYFELVPGGRIRIAWVVALSVASAVFQGASIGLLLPALQMVERHGDLQQTGVIGRTLGQAFAVLGLPMTLLTLLLGVLVMIVLGQVLFYAQQHVTATMMRDLVTALRRHTFGHLMRADMGFHHLSRTGALVSHATEDIYRTGAVFESLLQLISRTILIAFYAVMLIAVSWLASLSALCLVVLASVLVHYQTNRSKRLGPQMAEINARLYAFAVERFGSVRVIKLRNVEGTETERFAELSRHAAELRSRHQCESARIRLAMEPTIAGGGVFATYVGFTFLGMSLSELGVFMFVLIRMVPEAHTLNRLRHTMAGYISHFKGIEETLEEVRKKTTIISGSRSFSPLSQGITFKGVTVSYRPGQPVLRDVNLFLKAGATTAIIGPSGAGKSTILDLIVRLLDPQQGQVLFDGVDSREFEVESLRRRIGVVSQDILLLNDTVLENIRYGYLEASDSEVIQAAIQANAHQFIEKLPQGYKTVIGSRGMTLSGGERQRLELARAVLSNPPILLLDEVTSGLDAESERLVQESVFGIAEERMVVYVTHRLSMIRRAHKVVVIEDGAIIEEGTPEVLIQHEGLFSRYYNLQFEESGPRT